MRSSRLAAAAMRSPRLAGMKVADDVAGESSPSKDHFVSPRARRRRAMPAGGNSDDATGPADHAPAPDASPAKATKRARISHKVELSKDEEHFNTRFSVYRIRKLLPDLNEEQKQWISDAGFGALLSLSEFSVPVKLVKWIMQRVDPLLSEFRFRNKVVVFNRELVCKILGLRNGNTPVKLSGDSEEVKKLREVYKDGERAKIQKFIEIVQASNDRDSFMRAFTLLALGTVYTPGTGNYVNLKYLHSLGDISEISSYDWASLVIRELMSEVTKYKSFSAERLERDHQIGSCLIILAIAYIDHLDLPTDRGVHEINYRLPRICNITNEDFDFVMKVDKNKLSLGGIFWQATVS